MAIELNAESLAGATFKGPVAFYDYAQGGARQDFECVDEPRFGYAWKRETRTDRGRQYYMVDGQEVADLAEAARLLSVPPDPESPAEIMRRSMEEFKASPSLNYGATRAESESRCNADAGPFGMIRAFMQRAENGWHVGINHFSDLEREAGREFPFWLYQIKSAAHEAYRLMYLFAMDRKNDEDLRCAKGVRCRDCPILQQIETAMTQSRERPKYPSATEDFDIDAAKTWTCIGHILSTKTRVTDGAFLEIRRHHDHGGFGF